MLLGMECTEQSVMCQEDRSVVKAARKVSIVAALGMRCRMLYKVIYLLYRHRPASCMSHRHRPHYHRAR